jgi:hypothetical protein
VAKKGKRIIGFIEGVKRPPEVHPLDGYWGLGGLCVQVLASIRRFAATQPANCVEYRIAVWILGTEALMGGEWCRTPGAYRPRA